MKKSIESFLRLLRKKPKTLFFTCILVPIGISMMGANLEWLKYEYFSNFISLLGSMYTIVSLLLVFLLLKQYSHPDFVMEKTNLNYLNEGALPDLIHSLELLKKVLEERIDDREMLNKCYRKINYVFRLLRDVDSSSLSPYYYDIKNVIGLINKYKLRTDGISTLSDKKYIDISDNVHDTLEMLRGLEKERQVNE